MMTLMERARHEQTTAEVRAVAKTERIPVAELLRDIAAGVVVITKNNRRRIAKPFGIGPGFQRKSTPISAHRLTISRWRMNEKNLMRLCGPGRMR